MSEAEKLASLQSSKKGIWFELEADVNVEEDTNEVAVVTLEAVEVVAALASKSSTSDKCLARNSSGVVPKSSERG